MRLGAGVISVGFGFLSLEMCVLRLEYGKYKILFVRTRETAAYKFLCYNI